MEHQQPKRCIRKARHRRYLFLFPGRFLFLPTFILSFHLFLTYYVYENSLIIFFLMSGREEAGERNSAKLYRVV